MDQHVNKTPIMSHVRNQFLAGKESMANITVHKTWYPLVFTKTESVILLNTMAGKSRLAIEGICQSHG